MRIVPVRVIPNARKNCITEVNGTLKIHITAPAADGKANRAVIEFLADYFRVKKRSIHLLSGGKSRDKVVKIDD